MRTLFWIAVSNFVFPVILNIIQLIFAYRDPNFLHGVYIFLINNYVGIIGALLATLWCSSSHWSPAGDRSYYDPEKSFSAPVFASTVSDDTLSNHAKPFSIAYDTENGAQIEGSVPAGAVLRQTPTILAREGSDTMEHKH